MAAYFLVITLLICSCSSSSKKGSLIGIDPSWYPLNSAGKEKNILGFSTDLLTEMTIRKRDNLAIYTASWDTLFSGLQSDVYQAVISSLPPYNFNTDLYDFSDIYLQTGPVLIVAFTSKTETLSDLQGQEVGILLGSSAANNLEKVPSIIVREYMAIPDMLLALSSGTISGVVLDLLTAESYVQDLYLGRLKILFPVLQQEGLRLISLKGKAPELISAFNETLKDLKKEGKYPELLRKWSLASSAP